MTVEAYEKASELRSKIAHYADIKDTLANSVGRFMRVYTTEDKYELNTTATTYCNKYTEEVTTNTVAIREEDRNLMNRLIAVINEDIRTLQEEFEKL